MSEAQSKKPGLKRQSSKTQYGGDIFESKDNDDVQNSSIKNDTIDVVITFLPKNEKELIPNLRAQLKENNDIDFCDLIKTIRSMGFPVEKNMIYYYSPTNDLNVFCGKDPLPPGTIIPAREIIQVGDKNQISIRIRQNSFNQSLNPDISLEAEASKADSVEAAPTAGGKHKRTKERKIGQVIDKVLYWRKLYTGYNDPNTGQLIKMSLEEAANKVGISKKSLDDYLLQIRFGKKFGFNFNDHYNDRVGVLRAFVKKNKGAGRSGNKGYFDDSKMPFEMEQLFDKKDKVKGEAPSQKELAAPNISSRSKKISK